MSLSEKSARPAPSGPDLAGSADANARAEVSALLRQIGSPDYFGLPMEASSGVGFLKQYLTELLLPVELPAIAEACGHALRGEHQELVAQDQRLTAQLGAVPLAFASRRLGRLHLARLRPLRDERMLRRYTEAVETGRAEGWHTLVYGLTLALYSIPLRQGLLHYAQETFSTLARNFGAPESIALQLHELRERAPAAVEAALARC